MENKKNNSAKDKRVTFLKQFIRKTAVLFLRITRCSPSHLLLFSAFPSTRLNVVMFTLAGQSTSLLMGDL